MPLTYDTETEDGITVVLADGPGGRATITWIEPPSSFDEGLLEQLQKKLNFLDALGREWREQVLDVPEPTPMELQRLQQCLEGLDVSALPPVPFFASGPLSKRLEDV